MAANQSNNANAPGTFPAQDSALITPTKIANAITAIDNNSFDPKSPHGADPLNQGVPTQEASPTAVIELEDELGGSGTILVHGILAEADYNPDLSGRERTKIYDQMRKGDATCKLGLNAVKYPILSAKWYIKPGDGEDDTGEKVSFIKEELFQNPNFSWTELLRQVLLFCDYGNSFHEKVWRQRVDGKIGWKKFAPRLPHTVYRYTLQDGKTPGITQQLPTGGVIEIPQWKLMMFVLDMEGTNYEGNSLLRAAYKHWYYKDTYYKIDAIASERQGMGVPIIKVPAQATPADKARAKVIAKNMRVNEQSYIDLPVGFTIEYIDTKAKELKEVKEMVLHHDRQILKAFLAHFLDLGATSQGSFALSSNQSELYLVSLKYIAKIVQEQFNYAIRELVDLNFTGVKANQYPSLEYGAIGQVDFEKFSTALLKLAQGGYIVPDDDMERHIRNAMELPEAMEDSSEDHLDLAKRKIQIPKELTDPTAQNVQVKKPLRYTNKEKIHSAMQFIESINELSQNIDQIIDEKATTL